MIAPSPGLRVMIALDPVDFRKGAAGLATLVQTALGEDAFSRTIYVFRARRSDRLKLVFWDGTGLCLFAKTLDAGAFRWPRVQGGTMRLSAAQLAALIEGLDWTRVQPVDARTPRAMV